MSSGIYMIKSNQSGEKYIGGTANLDERKSHHLTRLKKGDHHNCHLQNHFSEHGNVFKFYVLNYCVKEDLLKWEQHFMDLFNPEFNVHKKAGSHFGVIQSEETRAKRGNAMRGVKRGPQSQEHKDKIGDAQRGEKHQNALFTNYQVSEIKQMINDGVRIVDVASTYNVGPMVIQHIKSGRTWTNIEPKIISN